MAFLTPLIYTDPNMYVASVNRLKLLVAYDTAKQSCVDLYGLHYKDDCNWEIIFQKLMIIKTLEDNTCLNFLSQEQIDFLDSRLRSKTLMVNCSNCS